MSERGKTPSLLSPGCESTPQPASSARRQRRSSEPTSVWLQRTVEGLLVTTIGRLVVMYLAQCTRRCMRCIRRRHARIQPRLPGPSQSAHRFVRDGVACQAHRVRLLWRNLRRPARGRTAPPRLCRAARCHHPRQRQLRRCMGTVRSKWYIAESRTSRAINGCNARPSALVGRQPRPCPQHLALCETAFESRGHLSKLALLHLNHAG